MKKIIILILILTSYKSKSQCLSGDCNNGYGQYQYGNGGVYQGNFKNGLENGSGTLILASGAKYIGEFYNGKKNGKGIYYYTSGEIQDGDFVNGNFVNGKDKLASGDTYIGEFLNGVWNGNGTYIWADGEKYVGGFKNGVFHGIGKKYLINGNIVEGEWSNGTMIKKTVQNTATTNTKSSEATTFPTNGLVGWWPFNGNANDESGNGNNGNVYGATLTSDRLGNPNKAYSFDGISNYILVPNSNSLNITGSEITISYWLYNQKIDNTQKGISKGGWDVGAGYEFLFSEEKGLQLSGSRGGLQRTDASNISFYNNWVHLVAVFNNGIGAFYINNVKVNAKLNGNQFTTFSSSSLPLIFGKRSDQNVYAKGYINGKMDDIAIWNRALSENEISSLYNSGINNSNNISTSNTKPSEDINCELARKKYLEQNQDVAKAGMDAWNHYTSYGKREGRKWPECAENANNNIQELTESQKAQLAQALKYIDNGNYLSSLSILNDLVNQSPSYYPLYIYRGMCKVTNDLDGVIKDMDLFINNSYGFETRIAMAYFFKGSSLIGLKNYDEGCKYLTLAKNSDESWISESSNKLIAEYCGTAPKRIELSESQKIIYSKAIEESEKGNLNTSLDYFNQLISQSPNYFSTYILRAGIKGQLHQYSQAVSDVDIFIKNSAGYEPLLANAYRIKGAALIGIDKLDEGCKYLTLAINKGDAGAKKDFETLCNQKNKPTSPVSNSACSFVFKKPILTITYIDNRTMCCYCKKKYAKYEEHSTAKETEEMAFLGEQLYMHYEAINADDNHKTKDRDQFKAFIAKNYNTISAIGIDFMIAWGEMKNMLEGKLVDTNRKVKKYTINSKFCSNECEEKCSYSERCECK